MTVLATVGPPSVSPPRADAPCRQPPAAVGIAAKDRRRPAERPACNPHGGNPLPGEVGDRRRGVSLYPPDARDLRC